MTAPIYCPDRVMETRVCTSPSHSLGCEFEFNVVLCTKDGAETSSSAFFMSREAVNLQRSGQNGWFTAVHTPSSFPIPVTRGQHAAAPREIEWRALVRPGRRHGPKSRISRIWRGA